MDQVVEVDQILIGAGRQPNVEGLGLKEAGVEYDEKLGVQVDNHLRTSNPDIFTAPHPGRRHTPRRRRLQQDPPDPVCGKTAEMVVGKAAEVGRRLR